MRINKRFWVTIPVAALLLSATGFSPASRPASSVSLEKVPISDPSTPGLRDASPEEVQNFVLAGVAASMGISTLAAVDLIKRQDSFFGAAYPFYDEIPDFVTAIYWDKSQDRGVVNLLRGTPEATIASVRRLVDSVGGVVTSSGRRTRQQRGEDSRALAVLLAKSVGGEGPFVSHSIDGVEIQVDSSKNVTSLVRDFAASVDSPYRVNIHGEAGVRSTAGIVGGAELNSTNFSAACTSGFMIRNPSTTDMNLLTAGHCPDALYYGNSNYLWFRAETTGEHRDLQRHWTNQTPLPKFQFQPGLLTTNKSVSGSVPQLGRTYNRYGRNGYESILITGDDGAWSDLDTGYFISWLYVTDPGSNILPGDSGGPWWAGASGGAAAVGIQSGCYWLIGPKETCGYQWSRRAFFTGANELSNYMPGWIYMTG